MGNVIHMDTEIAYGVYRQLDQTSFDVHQLITSLGNSLRSLDWQGSARQEFIEAFEEAESGLMRLADEGVTLSQRLKREVDEWIEIDSQAWDSLLPLGVLLYAAQPPFADSDTTPEVNSCEEAQAYFESMQSSLDEAEAAMDAAYVEAKKSYNELKSTKGTEMFQSIEKAANELYEQAALKGLAELLGNQNEKLINESLEAVKEIAPDAKGEIAVGGLMKFAIAAYYAWKIGEEGAMTSVLIFRNIKTNFLTFGKLLPARIKYELAYKNSEKAKELVNKFC